MAANWTQSYENRQIRIDTNRKTKDLGFLRVYPKRFYIRNQGDKRRGRNYVGIDSGEVLRRLNPKLSGVMAADDISKVFTGTRIFVLQLDSFSGNETAAAVGLQQNGAGAAGISLGVAFCDQGDFPRVDFQQGAYRVNAHHVDKPLQKGGIEILARIFHHDPQGAVRTDGHRPIHTRGGQGIVDIADGDDPPEQADRTGPFYARITGKVIFQMVFEGRENQPADQIPKGIQMNNPADAVQRMFLNMFEFRICQFSGLVEDIDIYVDLPQIVEQGAHPEQHQ